MRRFGDGEGEVLAGAPRGRRVFAQLLEETSSEPDAPKPLFLDFGGVTVTTASFLREAVLRLRDAIRSRRSNFYPVIANANEAVIEELEILLILSGDVLMICSLDENGNAGEPRLIGELDPKQKATFDLVRERGETDAADLKATDNVGQTAWNNRLAALVNLGLVIELSQGRAKRYRPVLMEN
jgi:hypothetical protein